MSSQFQSGFFFRLFAVLIISLLCFESYGQYGYSSASLALSRQRSEQYIIPHPNEIVVEEYYNYHKHDLPVPSFEKGVNLNLKLGNIVPGEDGILQVGISTTDGEGYYESPPVNIGLVIDRSGSMAGEKLEKTKKALLTMVNHLKPEDKVSIVAFDHEAEVLVGAMEVGNKSLVRNAIRNLQTRGSTDLNRGIITGYQQLIKTYSKKQSNRLIILTDAMTNTGQIDPEKIIANSNEYDASLDVDYVFIGVGMDVNYELARQLTASKKNTFHFIDNAEDITKVFDNEVASLLHPVAKNAELIIELPANTEIMGTYDFAFEAIDEHTMKFRLNNMNQELTQVVLTSMRFKNNKVGYIKASLNYDDVKTGKRESIVKEITLYPYRYTHSYHIDYDMFKNETIARMAVHMKRMAIEIHDNKDKIAAAKEINDGLALVDQRFPGLEDTDILRVYDIMAKYRTDLKHISER